ncbi:MAG: Periplasmic binding protein [Frankiales bacterium]|nr:Periplasmic binding protein [Frankiales bacterium]
MRRLLTASCIALPVLLGACGTTVPLSQQVAGPAGNDGLGDGLSPAGSTTAGTGTTPTGALNGLPAPSSTGAAGTPTGAGVPTSQAIRSFTGRGVTATTVTIGIAVATGTDALANSFGISGGGSVPVEDIAKAVVNNVNSSGGVLGRKLALQVHSFDAAQAVANPEAAAAGICSDYRDDHKVFAVLFDVTLPSLRKCLAEMGSPLIVRGGFTLMPASAYRAYGGNYLYGPDAITTEKLAALFVSSLTDRLFHSPWNVATGDPGGLAPVKLGAIHVDSPDQNALYAAYASELAKHGLKFADTVTYPQNATSALAATQNAVLKFRSDGITHVYGASAFFLQAAQSQGYHPRYAYLPGLGALGAQNSPAAQLKGAMTVGWIPTSDVAAAQDPGDLAGGARCRGVMRAAALSMSNRADLEAAYSVCDAIYSLRDALTAGGEPSVRGLRQGYDSLGARFPAAMTFRSTLSPTQHYGVSTVRDMAYDSACSCLVFTSKKDRS